MHTHTHPQWQCHIGVPFLVSRLAHVGTWVFGCSRQLLASTGRVLGSRSRSVLASTVSVRLLGCFGVGRFGSGLVLVWSGLSRLSVCLSSCPLPGLRLRLARDAQAKSLAHAFDHLNLVTVTMMSPTIMLQLLASTVSVGEALF